MALVGYSSSSSDDEDAHATKSAARRPAAKLPSLDAALASSGGAPSFKSAFAKDDCAIDYRAVAAAVNSSGAEEHDGAAAAAAARKEPEAPEPEELPSKLGVGLKRVHKSLDEGPTFGGAGAAAAGRSSAGSAPAKPSTSSASAAKEGDRLTFKDRTKKQRIAGQSGIGEDFRVWRTDEEMVLRQQID